MEASAPGLRTPPVHCPVCQSPVSTAHINEHLDRCLQRPAGRAEPPAPPKRRRVARSGDGDSDDTDDDAPARPGAPAAADSASSPSWGDRDAPDDDDDASSWDTTPDTPLARTPGTPEIRPLRAPGTPEIQQRRAPGNPETRQLRAPGTPETPQLRAPGTPETRQLLEGPPLADRLRPGSLQDYVGQSRALGRDTLLRSLLEANEVPSLILWGPPGCGKTTLAHIIANNSRKHSIRFVTLSATNAKTNDVRDVIKQAQHEKRFFKRKTILFIDEIHRFNKAQQDTFLPHVECGTITLIGATTENPSFQVNAALLSRCRVIVLEKLPVESVVTILTRAINTLGIRVLDTSCPADSLNHSSGSSGGGSSAEPSVFIEDKAVDTLAHLSDGDARTGLNGLQLAVLARLSAPSCPRPLLVTEKDVKEGLQRSHILYDRAGEEHYNCISALHKSMRGSHQNASLYWLARMLEGGEDPLYVARRLVRFASEDVGLADPSALTQAVAAYQGCHLIGMPECEVLLAQCVVYLARAPKSVEVYSAYSNAKACLRSHPGPLPPVPLHLRNAPTRLMKELGYGQGYKYNPAYSEPVEQEYLPQELRGVNFFKQRRF